MNSKEVYKAVVEIACSGSTKIKEDLLGAAIRHDLFKRVMEYAYNPFKTYGVARIPTPLGRGEGQFDRPEVWTTLDKLIARELTGDAARTQIQSLLNDELDLESAELLWRVLRKDMRANFGETLLNKVCPGLIPEFPYMRCSLPDKSNMEKWDWSQGAFSQEKADGMFANTNVEDVGVSIHSRQGSAFPLGEFGRIVEYLMKVCERDVQLHGELLVYDEGVCLPREEGNGILNSVQQGGTLPEGHEIRYKVWDIIPLSAVTSKGVCNVPYLKRLAQLSSMFNFGDGSPVTIIPTVAVKSKAQAFEHYRSLLRMGKEGTIVKWSRAIWKDGTSKDQVKLKLEVDVDLVSTEIVPGRPGTKNEGKPGSIRCTTRCGGLVVDVTVKNEAMRKAIEARPDLYLRQVYAVRANGVMKPGESSEVHSLFLPRFVEASYRTDKLKADSLEEVIAQFEAAVQ